MLLSVHPMSLREMTYDGQTLLSLAMSTATKSHPNYALIDELNRQLQATRTDPLPSFPTAISSEGESDSASRDRLDSNDSSKSWQPSLEAVDEQKQPSARARKRKSSKEDTPADLLLHFSRNAPRTSLEQTSPSRIAEV